MKGYEERRRGFVAEFKRNQELVFRTTVRGNELFGLWLPNAWARLRARPRLRLRASSTPISMLQATMTSLPKCGLIWPPKAFCSLRPNRGRNWRVPSPKPASNSQKRE